MIQRDGLGAKQRSRRTCESFELSDESVAIKRNLVGRSILASAEPTIVHGDQALSAPVNTDL